MKLRPTMFAILLAGTLLAACDGERESTRTPEARLNDAELADMRVHKAPLENSYKFGFDLRNSPQEDAHQYLPFLKYLSDATGLRFNLRFTPKNNNIVDDLGRGEVHFAAIGAISFIKAREKYAVTPLVRGLNTDNLAHYRSVIITLPESPLRELGDLRGRRFAFGGRTSTQGHIIPRIELLKENIALQDLGAYKYTGSHKNCADAVLRNESDACGMQDTLADLLIERKLVRELYRSAFYPSSGIAANADLPAEVVSKVKQALLNFDPNGAVGGELYNWHLTEMPNGFTAASVDDYQELADWLRRLEGSQP